MKKTVMFLVALVTAPVLALDVQDCRGSVTHLSTLYELRTLLMKSYSSSYDVGSFVSKRVDQLREPLPEGGWRWVRWVRPTGDGPSVKEPHTVAASRDAGGADNFETDGDHAYAVRISVPRKRSLLNQNNPVYIGTARVTYEVDGRSRTREEAINAWMNPDTSRTIDLGTIADRVQVSVDASTAAKTTKQAVVDIEVRQAVAQDDPANPAYSTIRMLERVRESPDVATIDAEIAAIERTLFPASESLPLLTIITDLRRADEWMRSEKPEDQEKGSRLLRATLRRLR
jgi:hypothetical protein